MFDRWVEDGLLHDLETEGIGCIVFSPLAQGLLTNRYLEGTPDDSRIAGGSPFLKEENLTVEKIAKARELQALAKSRGQSLAQMAVTWILRQKQVTSVLIGASKTAQIEELCAGLAHPLLIEEELEKIESILSS